MFEAPALEVSFRQFPENPQGSNLYNWEGKERKMNYICVLQRCKSGAQVSLELFTKRIYISLHFIYKNFIIQDNIWLIFMLHNDYTYNANASLLRRMKMDNELCTNASSKMCLLQRHLSLVAGPITISCPVATAVKSTQ
jgi:hypothetical protein